MTFVQRVTGQEGKICWHQWTGHALIDETGDIYEYQAVGRDITAEKELEKQSNTNIRNMEFLCQTAMEFAEISPDADIYRFIGECLLNLVPDSIVAVLTYHLEKDTLLMKYISNNTLIPRDKRDNRD